MQALKKRLYRTALMYLGSESTALDAVDEAVYKGFLSYKKLRNPELFDTWMTRILINECNNELRRRKRELSCAELPETAAEQFDALPLREAVERLPRELRAVVVLRHFSGYTLAETAEILRTPLATVAGRQRRALENTPAELAYTVNRAKARLTAHRRAKRWLGIPVGSVAGAVLLLCILGTAIPAMAQVLEPVPVIGPIIKVVSSWSYHDQNQQGQVQIPQSGNALLDEQVRSYTDRIISSYLDDVGQPGADSDYRLNVTYREVPSIDGIFVLRFDHVTEMNGSSHAVRIYNLDTEEGRLLTIGDIFREGSDSAEVLTTEIQRQMKERMEADDTQQFYIGKRYQAWAFEKITEDVDFYLNETGDLVILFDKYEVAPGSMGVVQFEIRRDVIRDILREKF